MSGAKTRLGTRLAIGGIAGLAASLALIRLQPKGAPRLLPLAFGAAAGALLAAAQPRPGRLTGALAGGSLWLAGEMGWLPRMTIGPARGRAGPRAATLLAGHLAWGWSAAEAIREMSADA